MDTVPTSVIECVRHGVAPREQEGMDWCASADCEQCEEAVWSELLRERDRLKAERDRALAELDKALGEREESDGWVRLPLDADGVPIRIGDVLDETTVMTYAFLPANVVGYHKCCGKVMPIVEHDGEFQVDPEFVCHYTKPTVEDVLREMADRCYADEDEPRDRDAIVAEYAAKLRLAGDEE